jgi:hypothetical protein
MRRRDFQNRVSFGFDYIEAPALDPSSINVGLYPGWLEKNGIDKNFSLGADAGKDISNLATQHWRPCLAAFELTTAPIAR